MLLYNSFQGVIVLRVAVYNFHKNLVFCVLLYSVAPYRNFPFSVLLYGILQEVIVVCVAVWMAQTWPSRSSNERPLDLSTAKPWPGERAR